MRGEAPAGLATLHFRSGRGLTWAPISSVAYPVGPTAGAGAAQAGVAVAIARSPRRGTPCAEAETSVEPT